MYNIGDEVRVIPKSYIEISKNFLCQPEAWKVSDPMIDRNIMLGGKYKVLGINHDTNNQWLSLLHNDANNMGKVSSSLVIAEKDFMLCKFKQGNKVLFKPKCSNNELKHMTCAYGKQYHFNDSNREYVIKKVLNDYYLFLDYDITNEYAVPFRWVDFILA